MVLGIGKKKVAKAKPKAEPKKELMHTCKPRDKSGCKACAEK